MVLRAVAGIAHRSPITLDPIISESRIIDFHPPPFTVLIGNHGHLHLDGLALRMQCEFAPVVAHRIVTILKKQFRTSL
jgi:hypothetical protein